MAATYKLRWDDGSKPVPRATFGGQREDSPQSVSSIERIWPVIRLHMANEATNGEVFLQPLTSIRRILESTVLPKRSDLETVAVGRGSQNALYSLGIEYIPRLLSYMPHIKTNKPEMGVVLLDTLCCMLSTEEGSLFTFLVTFSSSLLHLPCPEWPDACQEIVSRLCHYVLPSCLLRPMSLPPLSLSSTLMVVMETCPIRHHLLVADTLMFLKRDVCTDILSLIAYGTPSVGQSALKLLLHYWPLSSDFSRNVFLYGEWQSPAECENSACSRSNAQASTLCLDASCVSRHKGRGDEAKFYMLLCHECHSLIHRSVAVSDANHRTLQIPQPLRDVKPNCEFQKMCSGKERQVNRAEVTCYDSHCTDIQGGQPIRMCRDCHSKQHVDVGDLRHIYQVGPPNPWTSNDTLSSSTMLEAISKLLQCPPTLHKALAVPPTLGRSATHTLLDGLQKIHALPYQLHVEGSREGIWLLSTYCTPTTAVLPEQSDWLIHLSVLALDWLRSYHDILKQVEAELPASPNEDTDNPSPDVTEYLQYFSNYNDISRLVDPLLISWLCEVAVTNGDCLVEALQPNPQPCAQVGKLWEKDCDPILRYQSSLRFLHRLYQFFKSNHMPRVAFMKIYNSVMPEWLDLLVQLRTETGKMAILRTHYHRLVTHPHPDGMEMIEFVWNKFRAKAASGTEMQKALFWLQDLTRLKIALPYIHHMFESAMEQKTRRNSDDVRSKVSVTSSFDEEVEGRRLSQEERGRKGSTGSNASESESEPALLSESGLEEADAQAIASLNSTLTRSILMLDIWLSQMKLGIHVLDYGSLKRLLVKMLQMSWGSRHSYADHHDTTNTCLLCKATALWFSLATRLLTENEEQLLRQLEEEEDSASFASHLDGAPSRSQQQRISMKLALKKKLRKLTHGETNTSEDFQTSLGPVGKFCTFPRKKGAAHQQEFKKTGSAGVDGGRRKSPPGGEQLTDFDREFPPAEVKSKLKKDPLRKMATVQSEALQVLPALAEEGEEEEEEGEGEVYDEDVHTIFRLCRDHLKPKLHPEAIQKVVQCVMVLVRKSHVLQDMEEAEAMNEARCLFKDLWKCLSSQSSFVARSCVGLMIDCLKFLSDHEVTEGGVERSTGWTIFHNGLKTDKFRTVEKFCIFLEFMLSPETDLDWNDDSSTVITIQVTVAYSFCLAVQLLQDKTSSVASRAQYCLSNLSVTTLKALRKFIMRLFLDRPEHRILTLHSLSLLNTALPKLGLLTLDLLEHLISSLAPHSAVSFISSSRLSGDHTTRKKESVTSGSSSHTPKTSVSSYIPSSPMVPTPTAEEESELLQLALALLLKYLANSESDAELSLKKTKLQRGVRESSVELDVRPMVLSRLTSLHQDPPSLRSNPVFHVFLNHIYPVLDTNAEFSTLPALIFVLNRLIHCTAPTGEESFLQCLEQGPREGRRCEFGLGVLPPPLRVPWLRVFYIVLYKYIHNYQSATVDSHQDLIFHVRCCMEIALNTIETTPHTCPLLLPTSHVPSLRRQRTAEPGHPSSATPTTSRGPHPQPRERETSSLSPVHEVSPPTSQQRAMTTSSGHRAVQSTVSAGSVDSNTSVFLRPGSVPKLHSGLCSVCGHVTNEFPEDTITLCALVVATCCHRLPTRVSGYLVSRVIPALAKVINTGARGSYSWQSSSDDQPPGSASAVASNLLKSIVTQFADRRLFIFLFSNQFTSEAVAERVFTALGVSLPAPPPPGEGEGEGSDDDSRGITVVSPVTYFLQDAANSSNFSQDVSPLSLVHLALYVEMTPLSLSTMFQRMNLLDSFCRKLKTTTLLRDTRAVHAFLRVIIQLLVSVPDNLPPATLRSQAVHSVSQSLTSCLEVLFSHVYCPVVGLFQLAGHWYKTFLASPRDANRLVQLYISELRRALKNTQSPTEVLHYGTFVSLVQVLLLEENGYLGYVDGLTEERMYAPRLREQFEYGDIFLNTIQELQWDFVDAMLFLDAGTNRLPVQYVRELPRLKLLIGQLVALRVQHGRTPVDKLRRLFEGDLRPITLPSKGSHQRSAVRWYDHLSALHISAWLLLGAMCHNAVHQVSSEDLNTGLGGRCQLLASLDTNMANITSSVVWLSRGAMQGIRRTSDNTGSQCQYLLFTFTAIWTFYMESCEKDCTAFIVQFWENFVSNMVDMLGDYNVTEEKHRINVLHNVNEKIVIPLMKCGLSCFALLLPIWRKLSNQLIAGHFQVFPIIPDDLTTVTMDTWFKEMVSELVTVERESSPHIATTAL